MRLDFYKIDKAATFKKVLTESSFKFTKVNENTYSTLIESSLSGERSAKGLKALLEEEMGCANALEAKCLKTFRKGGRDFCEIVVKLAEETKQLSEEDQIAAKLKAKLSDNDKMSKVSNREKRLNEDSLQWDKSRVFSAANADELEKGDKVYVANNLKDLKLQVEYHYPENIFQLMEILPEYKDARFQIKSSKLNNGTTYNLAYFVDRPPKKWRVYQDTEELVSDYVKRFKVPYLESNFPSIFSSIYIKNKEDKSDGTKKPITDLFEYGASLSDNKENFFRLLNQYVYLDGTTCGIQVLK